MSILCFSLSSQRQKKYQYFNVMRLPIRIIIDFIRRQERACACFFQPRIIMQMKTIEATRIKKWNSIGSSSSFFQFFGWKRVRKEQSGKLSKMPIF